ncbi:uncharacterized protein [Nicotiana sylvestris]|uniref:uncharacterized protein n=1 Tax=Nicotiana sylvestris TaxID=4096 RepID=UPI00388CE49F
MAIFIDMIEDIMEIFMDDFSVVGNSFDDCFRNLKRVLQRCMETNLVLNWEKYCFRMYGSKLIVYTDHAVVRLEGAENKVEVEEIVETFSDEQILATSLQSLKHQLDAMEPMVVVATPKETTN